MKNNNNFINVVDENIIEFKSTKRGDMPYYTLSQVAALLNEDDSKIRYYTNIFDDILKIEIVNKQFRYTNADLDKLEFLVKLKNKGMSIKQIHDYCDKLSLDNDETFIKESTTASIKDFVKIISEEQSKQLNELEIKLSNQIEKNIKLQFDLLSEKIIHEQNKKNW